MRVFTGRDIKTHLVEKGVTELFLANIDDFVIYVNYSKPLNQTAKGHAFFTCPHCREILKGLNVLSNVEGF